MNPLVFFVSRYTVSPSSYILESFEVIQKWKFKTSCSIASKKMKPNNQSELKTVLSELRESLKNEFSRSIQNSSVYQQRFQALSAMVN